MQEPHWMQPAMAPYVAPTIVRNYSSMREYQSDAMALRQAGWQPLSVQRSSETNGCLLTFLLVVGLCLVIAIIGIVLLLCIPFAFTRNITVVYSYNPQMAAAFAAGASVSRPLLPPQRGSAEHPLTNPINTGVALIFRMIFQREPSGTEIGLLLVAIIIITACLGIVVFSVVTLLSTPR